MSHVILAQGAALKLQGRKPNDYSSKQNINLDPDMRTDFAAKYYIYSNLLKAVKDNEKGTIADTDSEFLNDFRVAVRRTRAGLSQLKDVSPSNIRAYYAWRNSGHHFATQTEQAALRSTILRKSL